MGALHTLFVSQHTCDGAGRIEDAHDHQGLARGGHHREGGCTQALGEGQLHTAVEDDAICRAEGQHSRHSGMQSLELLNGFQSCAGHVCAGDIQAPNDTPAVTVCALACAPEVKTPSPWTLPYSTSWDALVRSVNRGNASDILVLLLLLLLAVRMYLSLTKSGSQAVHNSSRSRARSNSSREYAPYYALQASGSR